MDELKEKIESLKIMAKAFRDDFESSDFYLKEIERFEKMLAEKVEEFKITSQRNKFNIGY